MPAPAAPKKAGAGGAKGSSSAGAAGGSRAGAHKAGDSGVGGDPYSGNGGGGEWQTGPMGSTEGEWETVSHKRSRPKKDRVAAANDANAIPGGLGL